MWFGLGFRDTRRVNLVTNKLYEWVTNNCIIYEWVCFVLQINDEYKWIGVFFVQTRASPLRSTLPYETIGNKYIPELFVKFILI